MHTPRPAALWCLLTSVFGSLFWRTFMLIALLITISLGVWFQSFRILEREPRAQQIAIQVVSAAKLTYAALLYSDPSRRRFLLLDLVQNESIKVYPREKEGEYREPHINPYLTQLVQKEIRNRLGADAVIATTVDDIPGVWVSSQIEDDDYQVAISPDRFEHVPGLQWLWWSMAALVLSALGAAFIMSRVNQPLKRLADTARAISAEEDSKALPEGDGAEVAQANHSLDQMVHDLKQLEADHAAMLAGVSHGLRTPLTCLRLETEMSPVDEQTHELMVVDIEQMGAIIGQFLDYTRLNGEILEGMDLAELTRDMAPVYSAYDDIDLTLKLASKVVACCNRMEAQRILDNLIENACRHGKAPGVNRAKITVSTFLQGNEVVLCVADRSAGVPTDQLALLTRPLHRLESAHSETKGAGLGMSIVNRILQRNGGRLMLENYTPPETRLLVSACYACA